MGVLGSHSFGPELGARIPSILLLQLSVGQLQELPSLTGHPRFPGYSQGLSKDLNSPLRLTYIDIGFGQAVLQRPTVGNRGHNFGI